MKIHLIVILLLAFTVSVNGQDKYFTKSGKIGFDATTAQSPEKIMGVNQSATCVLDTKTGNIQFAILMTGFEFERALMEEHFNENYVESVKYPRSEFKGTIENNTSVAYKVDGEYSVKVKGSLTMHGVTKQIETVSKLTIKGGKIIALGTFDVLLADFKISVPTLVADKVSKTAKITVTCTLEPLKS